MVFTHAGADCVIVVKYPHEHSLQVLHYFTVLFLHVAKSKPDCCRNQQRGKFKMDELDENFCSTVIILMFY